ncbi:MAG: hypothetical protein CTY31_10635 [Hyphomicrobium sp.]|nr:MAG: hypothetical protein CTY31_10635 [Hyphomicrobium sp.]
MNERKRAWLLLWFAFGLRARGSESRPASIMRPRLFVRSRSPETAALTSHLLKALVLALAGLQCLTSFPVVLAGHLAAPVTRPEKAVDDFRSDPCRPPATNTFATKYSQPDKDIYYEGTRW